MAMEVTDSVGTPRADENHRLRGFMKLLEIKLGGGTPSLMSLSVKLPELPHNCSYYRTNLSLATNL